MEKIQLNAFMTLVLGTLTHSLVLANTVTNTKDVVKKGKLNQTVDILVNVLANVTAKTYTAANKKSQAKYKFDALNDTTIGVKLEDEIYVALEIDGWDTMFITADNLSDYVLIAEDLARQISVQVEAALGSKLATFEQNVEKFGEVAINLEASTNAEKGSAILRQLTKEKLALDKAGVSPVNRWAVIGDELAADVINSKDIVNIDKSGSPEALREAQVTRVAGFNVLTSSQLDENTYVVYHNSAFMLVSREPGKNGSALYSEVVSDPSGAVDLRFNVLSLADRNATGLIVSTFFTAAIVDAFNRAIRREVTFVAPTPIAAPVAKPAA
jgi:hypothetical protein